MAKQQPALDYEHGCPYCGQTHKDAPVLSRMAPACLAKFEKLSEAEREKVLTRAFPSSDGF